MSTFAYYARWTTCDCVAAVVVDDELVGKRGVAKHVAGYIRRGLRPERLDMDSMREPEKWRCAEHPIGTPYPWDLEKKAAARNPWGEA